MDEIRLEKVAGNIDAIRTEVRKLPEGYDDENRLLWLRSQIAVCRDYLADFSRKARKQKELYEKAHDTYVESRIVELYEEDPVKWKTVSRAEAQAKSEEGYAEAIEKRADAISDYSFIDKKLDTAKSIENAIGSIISSINGDKRHLS